MEKRGVVGKRLGTWILVWCLLMVFAPAATAGEPVTVVEGYFTYEVLGDEATITGYSEDAPRIVEIPDTTGEGIPVTGIGDQVFQNQGIEWVVFGNNIRTIGYRAFDNNGLDFHALIIDGHYTTLEIPASVETIGEYAFSRNHIRSVRIGGDCGTVETTVLDYAFWDTRLVYLTLGDNVVSVGEGSFYHNRLRHIEFGDGLESIGTVAFAKDFGDTSRGALTELSLPESLRTVGISAFLHSGTENTDVLNTGLESIGSSAFAGHSLSVIRVPDSVVTMDDYALGNRSIDTVTDVLMLGGDVAVGEQFFGFDDGFHDAYTDGGAGWYHFGADGWEKRDSGYRFEEIDDTGTARITGFDSDGRYHLEIPGELGGMPVAEIADSAFRDQYLASVAVPGSVRSIGDDAFKGNLLTGVEFSADGDLEVLGDRAFFENRLSFVQLPAGLREIGEEAFRGNRLEGFGWPDDLESMGFGAFSFNRLTSVTVPEGITGIPDYAFAHNSHLDHYSNYQVHLEEVDLPQTLESVGEWAFGEHSIQTLVVPAGVESLGAYAFYTAPSIEYSEDFGQMTMIWIPGEITMQGSDTEIGEAALGSNFAEAYGAGGAGRYLLVISAEYPSGSGYEKQDAPEPSGQPVTFVVQDPEGVAVPAARIEIGGGAGELFTGEDGRVSVMLEDGSYPYDVDADGFIPVTGNSLVVDGQPVEETITLQWVSVEARIESVEAENGSLTITLQQKPTVDPLADDFSAHIAIDGEAPGPLLLRDFQYDGDRAVSFRFEEIDPDQAEQIVEVTVERGDQTVAADPFTVPARTFRVTYLSEDHDSGAVPVDTSGYVSGVEVTVRDNTGNLVRAGYAFGGWNTQPDGEGDLYQPDDTFLISEDVTFYAVWTGVPVSGVLVSEDDFAIRVGVTVGLEAVVEPADAEDTRVHWSSDDEMVVSVDSTGHITGEAPGTATITVTTEDGGHTDTVEITVLQALLTLEPSAARGVLGETVVVDVRLQDALQIAGADFVLSFDPGILQLNEADSMDRFDTGTRILEYDNQAGMVAFAEAGSAVIDIDDTSLLTLTFLTVAAGVTEIGFESADLSEPPDHLVGVWTEDGSLTVVDPTGLIGAIGTAEQKLRDHPSGSGPGEAPQAARQALEDAISDAQTVADDAAGRTQQELETARTDLEDAIAVFDEAVIAGLAVTGIVDLPGREDHSGVRIHLEGTGISAYSLADGSFLIGTPEGQHVLVFSKDTYLTSKETISVDGPRELDHLIALRPGDINNDGRVNLQDLTLLAFAFGAVEEDEHFHPGADLNGDGEINVLDLVLLAGSYRQSSDP